MILSESRLCLAYAERAVRKRHERTSVEMTERSNARIAAMLAEGKVIDEVLAPLHLGHTEKMDYVANNSELIKSEDGHEGIHLVWCNTQVICIHRLLSKEFRTEFQAQWLGVWVEALGDKQQEAVLASFRDKVAYREQIRKEIGINSEIPFAASPSAGSLAL